VLDYLTLALGVVLAGAGGELFVRGSVGLARRARVAPGIIGATVAAFATSSPELAVAVTAGLAGTPRISLGDALGSNVVNVALILGLVLCIGAAQGDRAGLRRDFPVALGLPVATALLLLDEQISRIDAVLLMGLFAAWMVAVMREARRQRSAAGPVLGEPRGWLAAVQLAAGLALLLGAGRLIVSAGSSIAAALGLDPFVVGATVVSVGTSVPELATAVIAKLRGHDEVGLGILLGSNIFNGLFIVAVAALLTPIVVDWREVAVALAAGLLSVALIVPGASGRLDRRRGPLLLAVYAIYLTALLQSR
jgi:cation:H+ antiporter